jgi:hypothetical protein
VKRNGSTNPVPPFRQDDGHKLEPAEILAIAFLAFGCLTGVGAMIWKESSGSVSAPLPSSQELRERVRQLEARLLERVPQSIERKYVDY